MVRKNAEIGVYADDRESEPRWTSMHQVKRLSTGVLKTGVKYLCSCS